MEEINQRIGVEPIPSGGLEVHDRADVVFGWLKRGHGVLVKPISQLHALVADGLFDREGRFHVMRTGELTGELTQEQRCTTDAHLAGNHAGLEQLFRARVIAFLVEARLLPVDRARMLRGWVHSGFQVFKSARPSESAHCIAIVARLKTKRRAPSSMPRWRPARP